MRLRSISFWTWELPQTLLGFVLTKVYKAERVLGYPEMQHYWIVPSNKFGGISLGKYILIGGNMPRLTTVPHEFGHQRQSLYFGPLYLLAVGIPSLMVGIFHRDTYFSHYPENWADKLGGVKR